MVTTPLAILSRVCAQLAGVLGMPGAGMGVGMGAGAGTAAAKTRVVDNTNTDKSNAVRDMQILRLNCVQFPWSDKIRSHTVPNKAKLSMTAADPMSLAMPARG